MPVGLRAAIELLRPQLVASRDRGGHRKHKLGRHPPCVRRIRMNEVIVFRQALRWPSAAVWTKPLDRRNHIADEISNLESDSFQTLHLNGPSREAVTIKT